MQQPKKEIIRKSENSLISQKKQQKFMFRRILRAFSPRCGDAVVYREIWWTETEWGHVKRREAPSYSESSLWKKRS